MLVFRYVYVAEFRFVSGAKFHLFVRHVHSGDCNSHDFFIVPVDICGPASWNRPGPAVAQATFYQIAIELVVLANSSDSRVPRENLISFNFVLYLIGGEN